MTDGQARIVGLFGAGRSGTTLLMRLLDASPGLWVYPVELNYLRSVGRRSSDSRTRDVLRAIVSKLLRVRRPDANEAPPLVRLATAQIEELRRSYVDGLVEPIAVNGDAMAAIRARAGQSVQNDLVSYLDSVRIAYDDRSLAAKRLLVFKSIEVSDLPRYRDLFRAMRFVHIIRNPYTNYASLKRTDMLSKQKPFWFQGGDLLRTQLELRWIPHARFILDACAAEPRRHLVVRYEDLCAQPATVVRDICQWLDVSPPADPTLQTVLGGKQMKELPVNPSKKGVSTPPRVVKNMAEQFGYDEVLTDREREFIRVRTSGLAGRFGYLDSSGGVTLRQRLKLAGEWCLPDRWEMMNVDSMAKLTRALVVRRCYIWSKLLLRRDLRIVEAP